MFFCFISTLRGKVGVDSLAEKRRQDQFLDLMEKQTSNEKEKSRDAHLNLRSDARG